jgi:hypothetical protein
MHEAGNVHGDGRALFFQRKVLGVARHIREVV